MVNNMTPTITPEALEGLAHEIWAAAQLAPGEGILDGTARIKIYLGALPELQAAPAAAGVPDDYVSVLQIARLLGVKTDDVIKALMQYGVMATIHQRVDMVEAELAAKFIRKSKPAAQPQAEQYSGVRITDEKGRPMTYWGGKTAPAEQQCNTCEPAGVFATDGTGPYDCYACGKKAEQQAVDENWRREEGIAVEQQEREK